MSVSESPKSALPHTTRRRKWRFRLLAIVLGLMPFFVLEAVCRFAGLGKETFPYDPFVEFVETRPLFVLNRETGNYEIPENRQVYFCPESFTAEKLKNEYRVFCLGGSTVHGRPYAKETAFAKWLELSLRAADDSKQWRTINCGGVSYASYRLVPILQEVLKYQPDLVIVYTGHNEFLEERTYGSAKRIHPALNHAHQWMSRFQAYRLLRNSVAQNRQPQKETLPTEVTARLDVAGALDDYQRDDELRDNIIRHFRINLERMAALCQARDVPLLFVEPVSNLRDSPPFKFEMDERLDDESREEQERLFKEVTDPKLSTKQRAGILGNMLSKDKRNAAVYYGLGKCYEASGQFDEAKRSLVRAKEEDICPLRILEPMKDAIREVASRRNVQLVRIQDLFESKSPGGIPGRETFVDHVHPNIPMHQQIAIRLTQELEKSGIVAIANEWNTRRDNLFRKHFKSLNPLYFERGRERLEGLRQWASGRAGILLIPPPDKNEP